MTLRRRLFPCAVIVPLLALSAGACSADDEASPQTTSSTGEVPVQGDPGGAANSGAGGDSGSGGGGASVDPEGGAP